MHFDKAIGNAARKTLNFDEFLVFFSDLTSRPEIESLMAACGDASSKTMSAAQLFAFMRDQQKASDVDEQAALALIAKFEPSARARRAGILTLDGFRSVCRGRCSRVCA